MLKKLTQRTPQISAKQGKCMCDLKRGKLVYWEILLSELFKKIDNQWRKSVIYSGSLIHISLLKKMSPWKEVISNIFLKLHDFKINFSSYPSPPLGCHHSPIHFFFQNPFYPPLRCNLQQNSVKNQVLEFASFDGFSPKLILQGVYPENLKSIELIVS